MRRYRMTVRSHVVARSILRFIGNDAAVEDFMHSFLVPPFPLVETRLASTWSSGLHEPLSVTLAGFLFLPLAHVLGAVRLLIYLQSGSINEQTRGI